MTYNMLSSLAGLIMGSNQIGGTPAWSPAMLPGSPSEYTPSLAAFTDAAKTTPCTTDGDLIYTLDDRLSTRDLVQATSGLRLRYTYDGFRFNAESDGADDVMVTAGNAPAPPVTLCMAVTIVAFSLSNIPFQVAGNDIQIDSGQIAVYNGTAAFIQVSVPAIAVGATILLTVIFTPTTATVRVNGTTVINAAAYASATTGKLSVGGRPLGRNMRVAVAELVMADSVISGANLTSLEAYVSQYLAGTVSLNALWGIQGRWRASGMSDNTAIPDATGITGSATQGTVGNRGTLLPAGGPNLSQALRMDNGKSYALPGGLSVNSRLFTAYLLYRSRSVDTQPVLTIGSSAVVINETQKQTSITGRVTASSAWPTFGASPTTPARYFTRAIVSNAAGMTVVRGEDGRVDTGTSPTAATLTGGTIGGGAAVDLVEVIVCNQAHGSSYVNSTLTALKATATETPAYTKLIVCRGDSITWGPGNDNTAREGSYPEQLGSLLGSTWGVLDYGIPGAGAVGMIAAGNEPLVFIPAFNGSWAKKICFLWWGSNDLNNGNTPAATYNAVKQIATDLTNAGVTVVLLDVLRRTAGGYLSGSDAITATYNAMQAVDHPNSTGITGYSTAGSGVTWAVGLLKVSTILTDPTVFAAGDGVHPAASYLSMITTPASQIALSL